MKKSACCTVGRRGFNYINVSGVRARKEKREKRNREKRKRNKKKRKREREKREREKERKRENINKKEGSEVHTSMAVTLKACECLR